jgi:2-keto-3-deoxy-L-rhamnonate aldolase RhmA
VTAGRSVRSVMAELSARHKILYGMICRDPTAIDMELLAEGGCHVVWIDLEHGFMSLGRAGELCRMASAVGMVPLVRVAEIVKHQIQAVLDAGCEIVVAPNTRTAAETRELVRLVKYPPLGERGLSSTPARSGYALASDVTGQLAEVNSVTYTMLQIESDEGLANLDAMLEVDGVDMITIGPADWTVGLALTGPGAAAEMQRRFDSVIAKADAAGKPTAMVVRNSEEAAHYREAGVGLLLVGVDIAFKRRAFAAAIQQIAEDRGGSDAQA